MSLAQGPRAGPLLVAATLVLALARLLSLPWYPLMDNTEARYADIARRMLAQGDWVTPWIGDGVPFWGKPPLSFWATQSGMALFGANEWGARLPHYLLGVAVAALVAWQARRQSSRAAWHTVAWLAGSLLFMVASGAVMTDMAMALGNTMLMVGFWRTWTAAADDHRARRQAAVLMVAGAVIGLLAKGPVSVVLWAGPLGAWVLFGGRRRLQAVWQRVAWLQGMLWVAALTLPWYLLAESRTPGFLQYFIVGEHWQRFTTPGWAGDLYGSAHKSPRGMIWLLLLAAVTPWTLLSPLVLWAGLTGRLQKSPDPANGTAEGTAEGSMPDRSSAGDGETAFLLAFALAPCVFFTVAGNILWTYVLPGLPALALLAGRWTASRQRQGLVEGGLVAGLALGTLATAGFVMAGQASGRFDNNSAAALLQSQRQLGAAGEPVYFIGGLPFSGSFYSAGQARAVDGLSALPADRAAWVVMGAPALAALPPAQRARLKVADERGGRVLLRWPGPAVEGAPAG